MTFSRVYPFSPPKAGPPTHCVEKIWNSIQWDDDVYRQQFPIPYHLGIDFRNTSDKKHHTVRAGHRFKPGDWFSPRIWSGRPYASKQVQFAPDIQVKKTWDFHLVPFKCTIDEKRLELFDLLAMNDGLSYRDFADWFILSPGFKREEVFDGQIICWNEQVEY